jgi:hypothetical protein
MTGSPKACRQPSAYSRAKDLPALLRAASIGWMR